VTTTVFQAPLVDTSKSHLGLRFQPRDEEILNMIYEYGGVVAKRQLKEVFWPNKTDRAMEKRLAKL
jgi:hypothetical protein